MQPSVPQDPQPWYYKFQGLMQFRVREILLVSSDYDAFVLEEDGSLTDRLFTEYGELNLSWVPRITHVTTAANALGLLADRSFDLVITVARVEDTDAADLSRVVKERYPTMPVLLLTFDETNLRHFPGGEIPKTIDRAFLWTGDARTLIAAIKLTEDRLNVDHDTRVAGVQVILVVEDRLRSYCTFLALLYPGLMSQSQSLIDEGLNTLQKIMRMRARPKILLANSYDEGLQYFRRYRDSMLALISDVRFPQGGVEHAEAGLELANVIRQERPDLPILLQSAEEGIAARAAELGAWFLDKRDPEFPSRLRHFLKDALGFGDFVFRLADGTEVGRARNIFEMEQVLPSVPEESIALHATRNDFSGWLTARSMFDLANQIRGRHIADFGTMEELRTYLMDVLREARRQEQEGVITDFSARHYGPENRFVRLGKGSIGGKGRSVAFMSALIVRHQLLDRFSGMQIRIPKTIVIGTDEFDRFMSQFDLAELLRLDDDPAILGRLLAGDLSPELSRDLETAFHALKGPLAVRSSSLLEDSRFQPFAGVYATYMLPNNQPDATLRFEELSRAIKAVYASTFSREARTYAAGTPHVIEEQRMGVVVQQIVGEDHGSRYYPHISGVAQSYNYYPIGTQKAEEGVAVIALGLGEQVVSGGVALRFSPGAPSVLPQFPNARAFLEHTQSTFYAVDLGQKSIDLFAGPKASLSLHDVATAEEDGTLGLVGSVYSPEDDVVRENLKLIGPRVITFNNILKWGIVPLAEALLGLLQLLRETMGGEVELEFAVDMRNWGLSVESSRAPKKPRLYLLQVRPLATPEQESADFDIDSFADELLLCRTRRSLGHGRIEGIRDVVYIKPKDPSHTITKQIAQEVGAVNGRLQNEQRPYVLVGPGRWGTSDPSLGIPVHWRHIAAARVIVEIPMGDRHVEYSQGTHFFQNVTALRIGYLTVRPEFDGYFDRAWLDSLPAEHETEHVRHVTVAAPLDVCLDGRRGHAAVLKHAP